LSIKRESLCNLRNFPSKKNHTCVKSIFKIWIFLKLRDIHYILRVYSCIWKKNWPIIIGNKFEITKNQSLPHYLPIEGFPYHQASHIHVLTTRNIGNVFSSAGICVLVQQTDLKRHFGESVVSCTRYNIISVANSVVLSRFSCFPPINKGDNNDIHKMYMKYYWEYNPLTLL
jgi:hypothetical protein